MSNRLAYEGPGTPATERRNPVNKKVWNVIRAAMIVLALGWTAYWTFPMLAAVGTQTTLGRSGIPASGLAAWQILQVFFVAAHYGIYWLAGLAGLGATGLATRKVMRRS